MISSSGGFWDLLNQWKNALTELEVVVFLHRKSETVLLSCMRGSIDKIGDNNDVMISADELTIMRFNLLNAKLLEVSMAEIGSLAKSYAEQLRDKQAQAEYLDPILKLILYEDGEVSISVMLQALRPAAIQ